MLTGGDWTLTEPLAGSTWTDTSDIGFMGQGPYSTSGTAKFVRSASGAIEDSVNFTVQGPNDLNPGEYAGEFNIQGSWSIEDHRVEIWSGGTEQDLQVTPWTVHIVD